MGATNTIDVSSYQGTNFSPSILKNTYGINRISMKFTQGANYVNPYAQWAYNQTLKAGSVPIPYHYTVSANYDQAYQEAQFFIKYLRAYNVPTKTPIMLDLEDPTYIPQSTASISSISSGWSKALSEFGYHNQILYMSSSWFTNYYNSSSNPLNKKWVAQYLNAQYYGSTEPNLSYRPNNADVWQFSSTWGKHFPKGYWGGSGLDVSHDYNNTLSFDDSVINVSSTTTTTTKKQEEVTMQKVFKSNVHGILTFFDDTNINGQNFKKGSTWLVPQIDSNGAYVLSPQVHVLPSQSVRFYYQPSPYNPDKPQTAKGKVVRVAGSTAHLYKSPTSNPCGNYAKKGNDDWAIDNKTSHLDDWVIDNKTSYLVGTADNSVIEKYGEVWLQLATDAYVRVKDVNFEI